MNLERKVAIEAISEIREQLDPSIAIWLGGRASGELPAMEGVEPLTGLDALEQSVARLSYAA